MGGLMEGEKMDRLMEGERMGELGDRWKEAGWMDKLIPEGNSHKQKVTKKKQRTILRKDAKRRHNRL